MARPGKKGLDYFPLDVDFMQDRKLRRITRQHGSIGLAVVVNLFCKIYRENGYYLLWDEDVCYDISEEVNLEKAADVQEVVDDCLAVDLFDDKLYRLHHILTSAAVQRRFKMCCARRTSANIAPKFSLIQSERTTNSKNAQAILPESVQTFLPKDAQTITPKVGQTFMPESSQAILPEKSQTFMPESDQAILPKDAQSFMPEGSQAIMPKVVQTLMPKDAQTILPESSQAIMPESVQSLMPEKNQRLMSTETSFLSAEKPQSKVKENRVNESKAKQKRKNENHSPTPSVMDKDRSPMKMDEMKNYLSPPDYALEKRTHNYEGLLERLYAIGVHIPAEMSAILRLSRYGEIGHPVWAIIVNGKWAGEKKSISAPGKYVIKILTNLLKEK
ncbi:Lin1244/Lin1753 domain-containing protein [uncultured Bacteroides sp.]|uniref:Lin1244/Lin1753 domain-containing protein n=1 Tax=uncultured Bacteroides sp. TaxID=162156 RepID=UPI002AAA645B|nr:Lin1244/Lin1753 domain-containing protein [uncultured Bacteroides sp.]